MDVLQKGKPMQIQYTPQHSGRPALRSGAIVGVALGIVHSVITIIETQMSVLSLNSTAGTASMPTVTLILYLLTPLIWIIGFLGAGTWAGRDTGRVSAGVLAGLFAGTFGGILAGVGQVVATALTSNQQIYSGSGSSLLLFSGFVEVLYVIGLALGAGAGFGVLGGLIGQSISHVRPAAQQVYAQPMVPYALFPAQPPQTSPVFPQPPQAPLPYQPEMPPMGRLPEQ